MEIIGDLYVGAGRLSASEEVHRQPGTDGCDHKCGKPGDYGSLKYKESIPQVQGQLETVPKEVAQDRRTDLGHVPVSDGLEVEEGRGRVDAVQCVVY